MGKREEAYGAREMNKDLRGESGRVQNWVLFRSTSCVL